MKLFETIWPQLTKRLCRLSILIGAVAWVTQSASAATPEFALGPAPSWVQRIDPNWKAPKPGADISGGVHYLLSDHQLRVDGGQRVSYRHMASKALNERGVESIANLEIRFDPSFQRLTLHQITVRRGDQVFNKLKASAVKVLQRETELETLIFDGTKTAHVFLDDVRVDDVVEYAYSLQGQNPVFGGLQFGRVDLQWAVPVARVHAVLMWPLGRALHVKQLNGAPAATTTDTPTHRIHRWDMQDRGGLQVERDAPSWYDPYPSVHWGEFKDWSAVVAWTLPLYRLPAQATPGVQAVAARIAAQHAQPGDRLLAAVRHVQAQVRYLGVEIGANSHAPSAPDLVLRRRFGDCKDKTLLTVALLRALNIEAHPALVHTSAQRSVKDALPSPGAFNHVLVRAQIGNSTWWLDPTRALQGGDSQQWVQSDFGAALPIDIRASGLSSMAPPEQRTDTREVEAVFDSSQGVKQPVRYTVTTRARGAAAESMRAALASQSRESLQRQYVNYYASYFKGIAVAAEMNVADDPSQNLLTLTEHYVLNNFWERNEKLTRLQADLAVPELAAMLRSPSNPVRSSPLALAHPVDLKHNMRVLLPSKWEIKPEKTVIDHPAFSLSRSVALVGTTLQIQDHYRSGLTHLPAAEVPGYVTELEKARDSIAYRLYQTDAATVQSLGNYSPHWLLAMLGAVAVLVSIWAMKKGWLWDPVPAARDQTNPWSGPSGLGGWLLFVGASLILGLFRQVRQLWESLPAYTAATWQTLASSDGSGYHPLWGPSLSFSLVSSVAVIALTMLATALYFCKRSSFPWIYKLLLGASLVMSSGEIAFLLLVDSATVQATPKDWGALVGQAVNAAIWISYMNRSARVNATFVRRRVEPGATSDGSELAAAS